MTSEIFRQLGVPRELYDLIDKFRRNIMTRRIKEFEEMYKPIAFTNIREGEMYKCRIATGVIITSKHILKRELINLYIDYLQYILSRYDPNYTNDHYYTTISSHNVNSLKSNIFDNNFNARDYVIYSIT